MRISDWSSDVCSSDLVTGRRVDGYHELDSLVAFADIADEVVVRPRGNAASLHVDCAEMPVAHAGDPAVVPCGTGNLAWRALAGTAAAMGGLPGLEITLRKRLTAGAGLGGGSRDAAAVKIGRAHV